MIQARASAPVAQALNVRADFRFQSLGRLIWYTLSHAGSNRARVLNRRRIHNDQGKGNPMINKQALVAVVTVLILPAGPAMGFNAFNSTIIKCGDPTSTTACATNPAASDPLSSGWVTIDDMGGLHVELSGALPNTTYTVFVGFFGNDGLFHPQVTGEGLCVAGDGTIGTVITDGSGNFSGRVTTQSGADYVFPAGTAITQVNVVFNNPQCTRTQFTTGIRVP